MIMRYIAQRASVVALTVVCAGFSALAPAQELAKAANSPIRDWAAVSKIRAAQEAQAAAANAAKVKSSAGAKELYINPEHAYPPSCLNNPVPLQYVLSGDPNALQAQVTLPGDPISTDPSEVSYQETDTIYVWRVACSGCGAWTTP